MRGYGFPLTAIFPHKDRIYDIQENTGQQKSILLPILRSGITARRCI